MTRRAAMLIAAYLSLGLLTTWAVAWGLALAFPMHDSRRIEHEFPGDSRGDMQSGISSLSVRSFIRPGSVRRMWYVTAYRPWALEAMPHGAYALIPPEEARPAEAPWSVAGPLAWGHLAHALDEFRGGSSSVRGLEEARGWPALAMAIEYTGFDAYKPARLGVEGGIALPPASSTHSQSWTAAIGPDAATVRALPARPIWPGLLADTLFYAVLFAGLHQLVGWGKRARRRGRGRCAACGYDITGIADDEPCPECGRVKW